MSSLPPFSLTAPRFDQSTYIGRTMYFFHSIDPRNMFHTSSSLEPKRKLLEQFKNGTLPPGDHTAELWRAREAIEASVHPDTKEVIFPLFRFAAFAPVNLFIVPYMLLPSTVASVSRTIGIHVFNQSYNASVNFANRNATSEVSTSKMIQGFVAAVTISVSGALGAGMILRRMTDTGSARAVLVRGTLPFMAVAFSGSANVAMMRREEWMGEGVTLWDEDGKVLGKSTDAGRIGLLKCASARFLWNFPCMVVPPLLMYPLGRLAFLRGYPTRLRVAETLIVVSGLFLGVAPALAFYPQRDTISVKSVEARFQGLKRANGAPVQYVSYNKGL